MENNTTWEIDVSPAVWDEGLMSTEDGVQTGQAVVGLQSGGQRQAGVLFGDLFLMESKLDRNKSSERTIQTNVFRGKFRRITSDNFEEFLKALNMDMPSDAVSDPVCVISKDGEMWNIELQGAPELKFKLNEEFDEIRLDGRLVRTRVTREGDKIVMAQRATREEDKSTESALEMNGVNVVVYTMTVEGVVYVQRFQRESCELVRKATE